MESQYAKLVGKTIESAVEDGYTDILTFSDGTVVIIPAYDDELSVYSPDEWEAELQTREELRNRSPSKFTEAIAETMRRHSDEIAASVVEKNSLFARLTQPDKSD